jgi:hypothetical protein
VDDPDAKRRGKDACQRRRLKRQREDEYESRDIQRKEQGAFGQGIDGHPGREAKYDRRQNRAYHKDRVVERRICGIHDQHQQPIHQRSLGDLAEQP